jgi:hypothetical protein
MERLVRDWWASRLLGGSAMIALRRADVGELNMRARALMRDAGHLGDDVRLPWGTFAVGDHVVLRRNDRRLGVANGDLGVVCSVDPAGAMSVSSGDRVVELPRWYLATAGRHPTVQHAYAVTGHVAQGMTVDRAFVLGSPDMYREWGYTAMSRGRRANRLYVIAPDDLERQEIAPGGRDLPTAYESLARGLSSSRAQTVALDIAQEQQIRTASTADLRRMREALQSFRGDAEIAATVRRSDEVSARVESLQRAADALERRLSEIATVRPGFHRRAARARHRSLEFEQLRKRDELGGALATAMGERAALDARLSHLRTAPRPPPGENRAQLQRIEDELASRASIERSVGRDTAIVRDQLPQ